MTKQFVDLFSGAGGMSCGLESSGMKCLLAIDHDKNAIQTFQLNHKNAKTIVGDISNVSVEQIKSIVKNEKIDLICGGPPCQGFSTIGHNDSQDSRNFLFREFIRIIKAFQPDYVIMENVTGILARKNEKVLNNILTHFQLLGYTVDVKVLSAHLYGVPQKRKRTIFLANKFGVTNLYPQPLFREGDSKNSDLPMARTVGWAFNNLIYDNDNVYNHEIERTTVKKSLEKQRISHIPEGKSIRYERDQIAYLPESLWFDVNWQTMYEKRFREAKLNRLDRNKYSNTINTNRTTYYHPIEDRYLTAREGAAIQSFPANYIFCGTLSQQWKQIGNAVPPVMAKAIGNAILQLDNQKQFMNQNNSRECLDKIRSTAFVYKNKNITKAKSTEIIKHKQLKLF